MQFKEFFYSLLLCLLTIVSGKASATTLLNISFNELVRKSGEIIEGNIEDINYESDPGCRHVHTLISLRNESVYKGYSKVGDSRTLRFYGGNSAECGFEITIPGMPQFRKGERVIVFLKNNSSGFSLSPVMGWEQGKFSIASNDDGSEYVIDAHGKRINGLENGELLKVENTLQDKTVANLFSKSDFTSAINEIAITSVSSSDTTPISMKTSNSEEPQPVGPPISNSEPIDVKLNYSSGDISK